MADDRALSARGSIVQCAPRTLPAWRGIAPQSDLQVSSYRGANVRLLARAPMSLDPARVREHGRRDLVHAIELTAKL